MGILTINDCGTAHEAQLLEIYNGLIDKEKLVTGKEPNSLEKSNIELQVAEAYQSILTICNDGGQISKVLELLKEKVPTMSINEISKVAVDVVSQVADVRETNENDIKDVAAFGIAQAIENGLADNKFENSIENVQRAYAAGSEAEREIIARAHSENATEHDKDMYVALSQIDVVNYEAKTGVKFEDLTEFDKGFKVKTIRTLIKEGKIDEAEAIKQQLEIPDDVINDSLYDHWVFEDNTMDEEDAEISRRIKAFSENTLSFVSRYDKNSPEKNKEDFQELMNMYDESTEKIDFGFDSLSEVARWHTDKMKTQEMQQLLDRFIQDIEDETQMFEVDQYMAVRMVALVNKVNEFNSQGARRILDAFNARAQKVNYSTFDFERICRLDERDISTLYSIEEKAERGQEAYERVVNHLQKEKIQMPRLRSAKELNVQGRKIQPTKIPAKKTNNDVKEKRYDSLSAALSGIYERDGMQGVMKCMQMRCVDPRIVPAQKEDWIVGFSRFLNITRNQMPECEIKQEDVEIITENIKRIILERGNNINPGTTVYKFVQVANEAIKGRGKEKTPILSANGINVKKVIENVSGERGNLFKSIKDVTDDQDGCEPEL